MNANAEAKQQVRLAQSGDQAAYEWLYEKYHRFLLAEAWQLAKSYPQYYEEFVSAGHVGFMKGIRTFDTTRENVQVLTYLGRCIMNEMRLYLRDNKKHHGNFSFSFAIGDENSDDRPSTLGDVLPAPDVVDSTRLIEQETAATILLLLIIWEQGRFAIPLYKMFVLGQEQAEAAKGFVSQSYLSRVDKKFRLFCKNYLENDESSPSVRQNVERLRPLLAAFLERQCTFDQIVEEMRPHVDVQKEPKPVKICSVSGCGKPVKARGYCNSCYVLRWLHARKAQHDEKRVFAEISATIQ